MTTARDITAHYARVDLLSRLDAMLRDDGVDPARATLAELAPYDQFHGRGIEATEELGALLAPKAGDRILDVGSGLGGPARWLATQYGCRVTGIDLTAEFVEVARTLSRRLGLEDRVDFQAADALDLPFGAGTFDGAYSMNVSMNIADKDAFYRSIHRVLKPGAPLVLSEVARGDTGTIGFPTPWAATAASSFLSTRDATRSGLIAAGFDVVRFEETRAQALAFAARSRALVGQGGKPPHRAVILVHGDVAQAAMANSARALRDGAFVPIDVLARKR
jgi:ubiquinone/menaquinone biosynthesis C-methylase UbiE